MKKVEQRFDRHGAMVTLLLGMQEVAGVCPGMVRVVSEDHYVQVRAECTRWCIHPNFKSHGQRVKLSPK